MYTQKDKDFPALIDNKEFRSVRNMIIRTVMKMDSAQAVSVEPEFIDIKIICGLDTLDEIIIGDPTNFSHSIISFHRLFDVPYDDREARSVLVKKIADNSYELKYCQRWCYPITCITSLIEAFHDVVWYLVEENHIYVSKFYWDNGVKEDIMDIEYQYYDWLDENPLFGDSLDLSDDDVWFFLKTLKENLINWESNDNFARYLDVAAHNVEHPFKNRH